MAQIDKTRNYYAELGVSPSADENEIRKAYKKLALLYHPDRNRGKEADTTSKFQELQVAVEILTDTKLRAKYDLERRRHRASVPSYSAEVPRPRPQPARSAYTTANAGSYYRTTHQRPPPPQQHTSYANGADRFTSRNFRTPPTAQRPSARRAEAETKADFSSAWAKMKQPRANDEDRTKSAKQNNPNNPNGTPFGRSQSTRTPSKKGFDPLTPGGDEGQARSSYRATYERPPPSADLPEDKPNGTAREGPDVPYAEGNRTRTPYAATAGERTSMFGESARQSTSNRNSPSNRPRSATESAGHYSSAQKPQPSAPKPRTFPFAYPLSSESESESSDEEEADVFKGRGRTTRPAAPPPQPAKESTFSAPKFQFDATPQPPHKPFQSKSEESINMKFSPGGWHGKFEAKPEFFAPNIPKGTGPNGRTSPTRGRPPQRTSQQRNMFSGSQPPQPSHPHPLFKIPTSAQMPPPPPLNTQPTSTNGSASAPQSAKFAPEAWAPKLSNINWAFGAPAMPAEPVKFAPDAWTNTFKSSNLFMPQTPKETSPRRSATAQKRPRPSARKASGAADAKSSPAPGEPTTKQSKYQTSAEDAANVEDDVMDIDADSPAPEKPGLAKTGSDFTFKPGNPISFSPSSSAAPTSSPGRQSVSGGTLPADFGRKPAAGLDGLNGLRNVEPLQPPTNGDGLSGGLTDLGDTLPFPSRASTLHPTKPKAPQELDFGHVPAPPAPPTKLDQASVTAYLTQMEHYERAFRQWDQAILAHFDARKVEFDSLDKHFISHRGETTKQLGFQSYMRKAKEDLKVRTAWNAGHEMHMHTMEKCEEVRNKTMHKYAYA